MSDKLILNITGSIMIETSLVSIGSNYKAVHSDTMSRYFTNLISNRMTPEQIKAMELKNAADTTAETQDGETPEGTETTTTTPTSENDVETTPATTAEDTTATEETPETTSENDAPSEEEPEAPATVEDK